MRPGRGIRSIAFSGGHREACRKYFPRKNRQLALVNYFVDNPGHNRVKCAEGTYPRRASWPGRQCRGKPRWWKLVAVVPGKRVLTGGRPRWGGGWQPEAIPFSNSTG